MASTTTATRRVLADLNVNTPPGHRNSFLGSGKEANSTAKPLAMAETVSIQTSFESALSSTVREEARLGGAKRHAEFTEDAAEPAKRRKRATGLCPGNGVDVPLSILEAGWAACVADEGNLQYRSPGVWFDLTQDYECLGMLMRANTEFSRN
jgi:hypothetical protein